ncbi:ThiF family adenylyltransferase [Marinicella sediminis]|uniref:ThiF family adenylyltransferase n=1 Tax=Marinicella sediminis TaxID=1792834 RepID=A0ABV7J6X4_9GAMM
MTFLNVQDIHQLLKARKLVVIDLRSPEDQLSGISAGAVCCSAEEVLDQRDQLLANYQQIVLMCYQGMTSQSLCQQLGHGFVSAEGGFAAWQKAGLPTEKPKSDPLKLRYQQQIKLPGFGLQGQQKLSQANILLVGAGGLGAPAMMYLAGAGVGHLTLVDDDEVSESNLHRQVIYTAADVGQSKVIQARNQLLAMNPHIRITAEEAKLTQENAADLIAAADLVIDGTDNIRTRYLINDHCLVSKTPWIYAAVSGFELQVAVFTHEAGNLCYRCLFEQLADDDAPNCSREGVLGPVPGMAAMIQVTEAIKYLIGLPQNLRHGMLSYNLLNHQAKVLKYPPNQRCTHR